MIPRTATLTLQRMAKGFPIIALTGPRQSGKTTLAREVFADKVYVALENPDEHEFAERDPRAFLNRFESGVILDEVQRCPHLMSWLQGLVDDRGRMGDFILTGSAQFDLISGITQSLAGHVGRIELLPFSGAELAVVGGLPNTLEDMLRRGALRPTAQLGGAGRRLRHLGGYGAGVAVGAGSQLPRGAPSPVSPKFWEATGQESQAVFSGRRADGVAAGHTRLRQHPGEGGYERQGCRVVGWRELQGMGGKACLLSTGSSGQL